MLDGTKYLVNPTGRFEIGGPHGDAGLTGRKIIVDTYGGAAPHGGGAFSGKDPSKVDRSAAYAARYVAKNIVAAGIATQCQVQLSYAIGVAQPINVTVYTEGTGTHFRREDRRARQRAFRPAAEGHHPMLDLLRPIYLKTAAYGHFGRDEPEFTWEATDKVETLQGRRGPLTSSAPGYRGASPPQPFRPAARLALGAWLLDGNRRTGDPGRGTR